MFKGMMGKDDIFYGRTKGETNKVIITKKIEKERKKKEKRTTNKIKNNKNQVKELESDNNASVTVSQRC